MLVDGSDDVDGAGAVVQSFAVADSDVARQLGVAEAVGAMNVSVHIGEAVQSSGSGVGVEILSDGDPDRTTACRTSRGWRCGSSSRAMSRSRRLVA